VKKDGVIRYLEGAPRVLSSVKVSEHPSLLLAMKQAEAALRFGVSRKKPQSAGE
jgi:hypothetical protein